MFFLALALTTGAAAAAPAGPVVAVKWFDGSGPSSHMGKGLADMLVTDLVGGANKGRYRDCDFVLVEWNRRAEVVAEIERQQNPAYDPATRARRGQLIQPQLFVEGGVTTTATEMRWSLQVRDAASNRIVDTVQGAAAIEEATEVSGTIARRLLDALCLKADYFGSASFVTPPVSAYRVRGTAQDLAFRRAEDFAGGRKYVAVGGTLRATVSLNIPGCDEVQSEFALDLPRSTLHVYTGDRRYGVALWSMRKPLTFQCGLGRSKAPVTMPIQFMAYVGVCEGGRLDELPRYDNVKQLAGRRACPIPLSSANNALSWELAGR